MYREPCFDLSREEISTARLRNPRSTFRAEFNAVLKKLGIRPGMQIAVHSSLASLGDFEDGAQGVCRELMELLTEQGTLMMSALVKYPASGEEYCYEVLKSPVKVGRSRKRSGKCPEWYAVGIPPILFASGGGIRKILSGNTTGSPPCTGRVRWGCWSLPEVIA